jgi:endonuclease YncB( thermonuclease family)
MWPGSDLSTSDEWLEVTSVDEAHDLTGWTVTSVNGSGQEVVIARFGTGFVVNPDEYVVVSHFAAAQSRLSQQPGVISASVSLPNTKLLVRLRDAGGQVIDQVDDGVGTPFAGRNVTGEPKASMERIQLESSGTELQNWSTSDTSRGWDEGVPIFGTPGFARGASSDETSASSAASSSAGSSASSISSSEASSSVQSSASSGASSMDDSSSSSSIASVHISSSSVSSFTSSSFSSHSFAQSSVQEMYSSSSSLSSHTSSSISALLRITEVLADPAGSEMDQWIEIMNLDTRSLDLSSWNLRYGSKNVALPAAVLSPGHYRSFRRTDTGIALSHSGGVVQLVQGPTVIDTFRFGRTAEGVSVGRTSDMNASRSFCVPTEASANDREQEWDAELRVQSGQTQASGKVTLNLETVALVGAADGMTCQIDFGDGSQVDVCNPGSHTFPSVGAYMIKAVIKNYCGTTIVRTIPVLVTSSSSSQSSRSSSIQNSHPSSSSHSVNSDANYSQFDLKIIGALPNPEGDDRGHEWVEIRNDSTLTVALEGWQLRVGNQTEKLVGSIGSRQTLRHNLVAFLLPNKGGSIPLLDPTGSIRSQLTWSEVSDGIVVRPLPITQIGQRVKALVLSIIDGDTFDVQLEDGVIWRVRLLGVDAPELPKKGSDVSSSDGMEAKNFLIALIDKKKIELEFDTEKSDVYGRLLAYVYLPTGEDLQEILLKSGHAKVYTKAEFRKKNSYMSLASGSFVSSAASSAQSSKAKPGTVMKAEHGLFITEVYANPALTLGQGTDYQQHEWIEFWNSRDVPLDLQLFGIRVGDAKKTYPISRTKLLINKKEYMVIFTHALGLKLNNDGQKISLLDQQGRVLQELTYGKLKKGQSHSFDEIGNGCLSNLVTPELSNKCIQQTAKASTKITAKSSRVLFAASAYVDETATGVEIISSTASMSLLSSTFSPLVAMNTEESLEEEPASKTPFNAMGMLGVMASIVGFVAMRRFG